MTFLKRLFLFTLFATAVLSASAWATPVVEDEWALRLALTGECRGTGAITQMAWGPDGRLYAARSSGGVVSFRYESSTGTLSDMQAAADIDATGIGFVASRGEMYLSGHTTNSLWRLTDTDGNGRWGEAGVDTRVAIVTNIPTWYHPMGQLQIQGLTLYLGIGFRGSDGGTGTWANAPEGESAVSGTICWIHDLSLVASVTDAARVLGTVNTSTIQTDASPYTSTAANKLIVHSAGARNPFGLAFDANGRLFFTNNYNRADTHGDGTSNASGASDAPGRDLTLAVHDQFFQAAVGADYGFRNDNWRGVRDATIKAAMLDSASPKHFSVRSITPVNLRTTDANYRQLHDPATPVGLGPSSSADGFAFWSHPALPAELSGCAFVTRYNKQIKESAPGTRAMAFSDLVAVDPSTGMVRRVAHGFVNPLAVLADSRGHLLVADWGDGAVFTFTTPRDSDGDGIPDYWLAEKFGHATGTESDRSKAGDDADGDRATNYEEFRADTNPLSGASVLRVLTIDRNAVGCALQFPSAKSRKYRVEVSPDLSANSWEVLADGIQGTGGTISVTDSAVPVGSRRFYRVVPLAPY